MEKKTCKIWTEYEPKEDFYPGIIISLSNGDSVIIEKSNPVYDELLDLIR